MTHNIRKHAPEGAQWFSDFSGELTYFKSDAEGQIYFYDERGEWVLFLHFNRGDMTVKNGFHAIEISKSQFNWFWIIYTVVASAVFTYIYMGK